MSGAGDVAVGRLRHNLSGVMIRPVELAAIKAATVDLAFRRWERPRVVVGTRMRTAVGLIEVTSVEPVDELAITEDDARRAGAASLDALRRGLAAKADRPVFRVGLRWAGEDPRIALRQRPPTEAELAAIRARLDHLDAASSIGPWTRCAMISDQTCVSQNAATEISSDRPILSGCASPCHWTVTSVVTSSEP